MRIHTNKLSPVYLIQATDGLAGVYVTYTEHRSRTHDRAFEVYLTGNSPYRTQHRSVWGEREQAATWDEWGVFLSRLFAKDWAARAGSVKRPVYRDSYDYSLVTGYRFVSQTLPKDTHARHAFVFNPVMFYSECKHCSAVHNPHRAHLSPNFRS